VNVDVSASISSSNFASATLMAFGQQWSSSETNQSATVVVNTMFSVATGTIYTIELSANAIEGCFDLCQTSSDAASAGGELY
jgi:predicted RecA/RadA family phage recombinase